MTDTARVTTPEATARRAAILVLGTADWDQPIATNQHYVTRELLRVPRFDVMFVESLALRRPQLTRRDLSRVLNRVRAALGPRRQNPQATYRDRPDRLTVLSPLVVPVHRGFLSLPNRILLRSRVKQWIEHDGPKVLWAYTPVTYGLEQIADSVVYHCVDLLGAFPGIDRVAIDRGERRLASVGARAAATSAVVKKHLEAQGFESVELWENVADTDVIATSSPSESVRIAGRVIFSGNLSPKKVNYEILIALAQRGLHVSVAGPRAEGGGADSAQFDALLDAGVEYLGMLTLPELSHELARSTVGLVPYALNEYTHGVSPLKTYEYLAAGLSVVSTEIPGVRPDGIDVHVAQGVSAFVERCIELSAQTTAADVRRRIASAAPMSWTARGAAIRTFVSEGLEGS